MLPWSLHLNCSLNVVAPTRNQRAAVGHHTPPPPPPPPNVLHLKRLSRGRRVDELDRPSGFATDRDATKESVCAEQKAAGDWSQRSAIGEARREKTRNGAGGFFFFLNTAAIVGERVDLAILLVLQPEWRKRSGFYKEAGPGVGFKVFACMSLICQGCGDTLTSCQVAAAC